MADPLSQGRPFEAAGLWRPSTFVPDLESHNDIHALADLDLESLRLEDGRTTDPVAFDLEIPPLRELRDFETPTDSIDDRVVHDQAAAQSNDEAPQADMLGLARAADVWDFPADAFAEQDLLTLHTWEGFEGKDVPNVDRTTYISEAGPAAFNAMLASVDHGTAKNGSLPQDVLLPAFRNLVLGRSSIFFQWNAAKRLFHATLPDVPVAGFSPECSDSVVEFFIEHGSDVRRLYEDATSPAKPNMTCPTVTALKRCIESILDHMELALAGLLESVRTILQLQNSLRRSRDLLDVLLQLSHAIHDITSDEQAIGLLSDAIGAMVEAGSPFTALLRIILARASQPWIDALLGELGLIPASPGLGVEGSSDQVGQDVGLDASLDSAPDKHADSPSFINEEDRQTISETKASLRLLRRYFPDDVPRENTWTLHARASVSTFESAQAAIEQPSQLASSADIWTMDQSNLYPEAQIDPDCVSHDHYSCRDLDVRDTVVKAFDLEEEPGSGRPGADLLEASSLNPLEPLRPSIEEQARQVSRTLLRLLFRQCGLRKHLALQRSFHLFGNGDFVLRLCTALFSSDTQSAERTRGKTPTSQTVGLRLGAREGQHWPPASSELQLSLKDVLSDVYHRQANGLQDRSRTNELPGGLSFTIRELPDAEIERVMDATSIYALDFLKLQYTAPPPLDAVITPTSLKRYDDVFRYVLKVIRLQDVTTRLRPAAHDSAAPSRAMVSARHFITTLLSHTMELGIEGPWRDFERTLAELEEASSSSSSSSKNASVQITVTGGLLRLRTAHDECLETMRERLFLKRKQAKLRSGLEDVFQAIMRVAACWQLGQTVEAEVEEDRFHTAATQLVADLQDHVDRPLKARAASDLATGADDGDASTTHVLLARLNWNQFYAAEVAG
nr:hypothetical protein CFP56_16800 [Quercus suber]